MPAILFYEDEGQSLTSRERRASDLAERTVAPSKSKESLRRVGGPHRPTSKGSAPSRVQGCTGTGHVRRPAQRRHKA